MVRISRRGKTSTWAKSKTEAKKFSVRRGQKKKGQKGKTKPKLRSIQRSRRSPFRERRTSNSPSGRRQVAYLKSRFKKRWETRARMEGSYSKGPLGNEDRTMGIGPQKKTTEEKRGESDKEGMKKTKSSMGAGTAYRRAIEKNRWDRHKVLTRDRTMESRERKET